MPSNRKLIALGVVLAVAVSGIALAQNTPEHHSMGPDQQQMMESGQHPMGQDQMQEMMRQHQGTMPMGGHPGMLMLVRILGQRDARDRDGEHHSKGNKLAGRNHGKTSLAMTVGTLYGDRHRQWRRD